MAARLDVVVGVVRNEGLGELASLGIADCFATPASRGGAGVIWGVGSVGSAVVLVVLVVP